MYVEFGLHGIVTIGWNKKPYRDGSQFPRINGSITVLLDAYHSQYAPETKRKQQDDWERPQRHHGKAHRQLGARSLIQTRPGPSPPGMTRASHRRSMLPETYLRFRRCPAAVAPQWLCSSNPHDLDHDFTADNSS